MNNKRYKQYLQSDHWQEKRKSALSKSGYTCESCGISGRRLDVHHKNYDRVGRERPGDLIVLCRHCHKSQHGKTGIIMGFCPHCSKMAAMSKTTNGSKTTYICSNGHRIQK